MAKVVLSCLVVFLYQFGTGNGILYPRESVTRELLSLDGIWLFSLSSEANFTGPLTGDDSDKDLHLMPVPSSYNDILTTTLGRDHFGPVTYQRTFIVPKEWIGYYSIFLRFNSVNYKAEVFVNGDPVGSHEMGQLPFAIEISSNVQRGENTVRVEVDNTLLSTTIPQGTISTLPGGRKVVAHKFDYFHYAGIDRSVLLYKTPNQYIDDISISTTIDGTTGVVNYGISLGGASAPVDILVTIFDQDGTQIVASEQSDATSGTLQVENASLWWPYLMSTTPGYLYKLRVDLILSGDLLDRYEEPFGIRQLSWDNSTVKMNGKPLYLRGFGRHEDSDIRGKGVDLPLIIRDYNLIKWIGANAYRTSHYPYADEIMDMADKLGIMIIDEIPAVMTEKFTDTLLENHKRALTEINRRDKNRPSVIMWSIADSPESEVAESEAYFGHVAAHIRSFDSTRPITIANTYTPKTDLVAQHVDILSFNRFNGFASNTGDSDTIIPKVISEATDWHTAHNKPVLITEYGSESMPGFHILPHYVWSEEYQMEVMSKHFEAFDQLRTENDWFLGELVWNFADFITVPNVNNVGGNRNGIFTRQREPKSSAHLMRKRFWGLAKELDNATIPTDMDGYVIKTSSKILREEL